MGLFRGYVFILKGFFGQFYLDLSVVIVFHNFYFFIFSPLFLFTKNLNFFFAKI